MECCYCDKTGHMKNNYRAPKKMEEKNNNSANAVTKEVQNALLLSVDNLIDFWVMDLGASFYTTIYP